MKNGGDEDNDFEDMWNANPTMPSPSMVIMPTLSSLCSRFGL